jgi:protein SCO1/2
MTSMPGRRRPRAAVVAGGVVAVLLTTGCGASPDSAAGVPLSEIKGYAPLDGTPLGPAAQTVRQADGGNWSYGTPAAGKLTLLYFGYTSCPDVCPTTMSDLAAAILGHLTAAQQAKVWVEFVSTDPHRDTPQRLHHWIEVYSPTFHAGRAPILQVVAAARAYGISITPPKITKNDYQVTHGAQVIVLDQHGGEVGYFRELAGTTSYAQALPTLIEDYA